MLQEVRRCYHIYYRIYHLSCPQLTGGVDMLLSWLYQRVERDVINRWRLCSVKLYKVSYHSLGTYVCTNKVCKHSLCVYVTRVITYNTNYHTIHKVHGGACMGNMNPLCFENLCESVCYFFLLLLYEELRF